MERFFSTIVAVALSMRQSKAFVVQVQYLQVKNLFLLACSCFASDISLNVLYFTRSLSPNVKRDGYKAQRWTKLSQEISVLRMFFFIPGITLLGH